MSETYNPRDNTFIKKPEIKHCVTCGQPIMPEIKPMNNFMSNYVNDISGNVIAVNSNEQFLEIQGVKLRRSDVPKPVVAAPVVSKPATK